MVVDLEVEVLFQVKEKVEENKEIVKSIQKKQNGKKLR